MMKGSNITNTVTDLLLVSLIGGVSALALSMILGGVLASTNAMVQIGISISLIVAALAMAKTASIDDTTWFQAVIYFAGLTAVGSVVGLLYAPATKFLLSVGNMTMTGVLWTVLYVEIAQAIKAKAGI